MTNWARSTRGPQRDPAYRRMSVQEKQRLTMAKVRRVGLVRCDTCQTMVIDRELDEHQRDRCPGKPWSEVATPQALVSPSTRDPCG